MKNSSDGPGMGGLGVMCGTPGREREKNGELVVVDIVDENI